MIAVDSKRLGIRGASVVETERWPKPTEPLNPRGVAGEVPSIHVQTTLGHRIRAVEKAYGIGWRLRFLITILVCRGEQRRGPNDEKH